MGRSSTVLLSCEPCKPVWMVPPWAQQWHIVTGITNTFLISFIAHSPGGNTYLVLQIWPRTCHQEAHNPQPTSINLLNGNVSNYPLNVYLTSQCLYAHRFVQLSDPTSKVSRQWTIVNTETHNGCEMTSCFKRLLPQLPHHGGLYP